MSFSAPTPPDPTQTSNTQQTYNTQAAQQQNQTNSYNQNSAFGSINYVPDSSSPSGYTLQTSYSQPEQNLFNQYTGTQGAFGAAAPGLVSQGASDLTARANLDPTSVTNQLNNWSSQYLQPIFGQQQSNTDAQLRNQGLNPGSAAYNNAENLLARNQGDVTNQYLQQNEGQAYNQALQSFQAQQAQGQAEAGLGGTLFGASAPTAPTQNATPTASIQPANYQGAVQSNYTNQLQNYENTWNNVGKLGTAAAGLALAPVTGGTSLLGSLGAAGGMFGSTPNYGQSGNISVGNYTMPQFNGGWS